MLRVALLALLGAASASSSAAPARVILGEVTTKITRKDSRIAGAFKSAVEDELSRIDLSQVKSRDRYVLAAALTKLDTRSAPGYSESTCVVSATLTRKRGGAVHAILRGRAKAQDGPKSARVAELAAIQGAVHSVVNRVPEALK